MQDVETLYLAGMEPVAPPDGPLQLRMTWTFHAASNLYEAGWLITAGPEHEAIRWGDSHYTWTKGCEFAEAAFVVPRLRETRALVPPF